eukprot:COSAG06_NODE_12284_length_1399_cov_2.686154_3_plen_25_part_01
MEWVAGIVGTTHIASVVAPHSAVEL